jgi:N6-adenosine-specific RNA methylase IME4
VLLNNISYIIKDISYLSLYKVKYKSINNKLIFNLDLLVLKYKGDAIYKRIKVFKLNYNRVIKSIKQWGTSLKS